jgi:hypothetical protein
VGKRSNINARAGVALNCDRTRKDRRQAELAIEENRIDMGKDS